MADQFIYCPQCGSDAITELDWDTDEGEDSAVECDSCGWEGDASELVCKDEENEVK